MNYMLLQYLAGILIIEFASFPFHLKLTVVNYGLIKHPISPILVQVHTNITRPIFSVPINTHLWVKVTISKDPMIVDTPAVHDIEFQPSHSLWEGGENLIGQPS